MRSWGTVFKYLRFACGLAGLFTFSGMANAGPGSYPGAHDDIRNIQGTLTSLHSRRCRECEARKQISSVSYDCPQAILQNVMKDRRSGWIVPSANQTCQERAPDVLTSPEKLEDYLRLESGLSFQNGVRTVTEPSCLSSSQMSELTLSERRQAVAEYYYSINRLQDGILSTTESIAAIDSLMGKKPFEPSGKDSCGDPRLAKTLLWCQKLQQCSPKGGFDELVADTDRVLTTKLRPLEAQLISLAGKKDPASQRIRTGTQQAIDGLKRLYPWLSGKEFQAEIRKDPSSSRNALWKQLSATRAALSDRYRKLTAASRCLDGGQKWSTDCAELQGALAISPEIPIIDWRKRKGTAAKQILDVNSQFDRVRCKLEHRNLKSESNKSLGLFASGVVLTAATLGAVSSVVLGAAIMGGTVATTAVGVADAVKKCDELLNHVDAATAVSGPSCPGKSYGGPQLQKYKGCLEIALVNGAMITAPIIAKGAGVLAKNIKGRLPTSTKVPPMRAVVDTEPAFTAGFEPKTDPSIVRLFQDTFGGESGAFFRGIRVPRGGKVANHYKRSDGLGSMFSTKPDDVFIYGERPAGPGGYKSPLDSDEIVVMIADLKPQHIQWDPYETMEHIFVHPEMNLKHSSVNYRELRIPVADMKDRALKAQWAARIRELSGLPPE
ncbi:MAG: hypothetical protein A2X94_04790 [Bdellovibrionales bacterium GWB1_55_8]|nr:MAG: hypothetical protein A2X94_04790 [Bdellovibrionales bacterium GWB1_55_8]